MLNWIGFESICHSKMGFLLMILWAPWSETDNQAFVIPTPLAIVFAICQGPLRLSPWRIACLRETPTGGC